MSAPPLTGALEGLDQIGLEHRDRYRAAVEAGAQTGWGYYFPHLLGQDKPGRCAVLVTEDDGSICVFRWKRDQGAPRLDLYLPPIPFDPGVLRRSLQRANDFNGNREALVVRVDARDAEAMRGERDLDLAPRREQYLFAPKTYESLAGKPNYTIRRNVAHVERLGSVEVAALSHEHLPLCHALLKRWKREHKALHGTAGGAGTTKRGLELAAWLPGDDLRGEVVSIDGELVAFALGGVIREGLACSFDRKCDTSIRGLSFFHFRSFLLRLRDFDLVNDGSDTGREGLRQLKQSFRPVAIHTEYRARQR